MIDLLEALVFEAQVSESLGDYIFGIKNPSPLYTYCAVTQIFGRSQYRSYEYEEIYLVLSTITALYLLCCNSEKRKNMTMTINYRWYNKQGNLMVNVTYYNYELFNYRNRDHGRWVTTNMLLETWIDKHGGVNLTQEENNQEQLVLEKEKLHQQEIMRHKLEEAEELRIQQEWEEEKFRD